MLGQRVGLQPAHLRFRVQLGPARGVFQRGAGHASALQGEHILAFHVGGAGRQVARAVGRMQRFKRRIPACMDIGQGRGRPRPGAGADQLLARQRLVEPVGVRQRHGDAGGEGGLGRIGAHAGAELRQRFRPAAQVAQRARHRQPNVGGRLCAGGQLRVGLRHLVGPARPTGHQDAVLDGARAAGRTQGAQHGQRRLVVAGARAQD